MSPYGESISNCAIDANAGYGYFAVQNAFTYHGRISKRRLSDLAEVASYAFGASSIIIDPIHGHAYIGSGASITKCRLSDFSIIDTRSSVGLFDDASIDPDDGYTYFGSGGSSPVHLVKTRLSDFSIADFTLFSEASTIIAE